MEKKAKAIKVAMIAKVRPNKAMPALRPLLANLEAPC